MTQADGPQPGSCTARAMRLDPSHLKAYAELLASLQGDEPSAVLERMTRRVETGDLDLADVFVEIGPDGLQVTGSLRLFRRGPDEAVLMPWRGRDGYGTRESIARLLMQARRRAGEMRIRDLGTRVHDDQMTPDYEAALLDARFERVTRRVEYKTPLDQMALEDTSDLVWRTMVETGEDLVLHLLREASIGSPDAVDTSVGSSAIENTLGARYEDLDPRAIQIGYLKADPVAILFCLATPEDGWSTIAFIGIVPSHRGRGLGLPVHRHGIATLRALGGTTYHDGTSETNGAMMRLFARQGCVEYARMSEWRAAPCS